MKIFILFGKVLYWLVAVPIMIVLALLYSPIAIIREVYYVKNRYVPDDKWGLEKYKRKKKK